MACMFLFSNALLDVTFHSRLLCKRDAQQYERMSGIAILGWVIPFFVLIMAYWILGLITEDIEQNPYSALVNGIAKVGNGFSKSIMIFHTLLWVLPFSGLIWIIGFLFGTTIKRQWRENWKNYAKPRSALIAIWLCSFLVVGFLPTSTPMGSPGWGNPLSTENTDAPLWPSSEQHIWVVDSSVIAITHQNIPAHLCPYGTGTYVSWVIETFKLDEHRVKQVVEKLPTASPDLFHLETVPSEGHHRYKSVDGSIDVDLIVSRRNVISEFPIDGIIVAEMITVYVPNWGGEMQMLTITQLYGNDDPWAESIVLEWLSIQN